MARKRSSSWEKAVKFVLDRSGSDPLSELTDEQIYKAIIDSDLSNEKRSLNCSNGEVS